MIFRLFAITHMELIIAKKNSVKTISTGCIHVAVITLYNTNILAIRKFNHIV